MNVAELFSVFLILCGCFFFLAGTVGLLRFPDVYTRLHALTKADTLGLGFVVLGLIVRAGPSLVMFKLALIWILAAIASASIAHLIAEAAHRQGLPPWSQP